MSDSFDMDTPAALILNEPKPHFFFRVVAGAPVCPENRVFEFKSETDAMQRFTMEIAACYFPKSVRLERVEHGRVSILREVPDPIEIPSFLRRAPRKT